MVFYNKKFERWINLFIENPFKSWWKARKYFKLPKISIHFFSNPIYNCPYASFKWIGKILDIRSCDVQFKYKYDDIRYEYSPYIWVCFFKRFGFSINFNTYYKDEFGDTQLLDDFYWEYLLNYVYENKSLIEAFGYWYHDSKICKEHKVYFLIPIVPESLNKCGLKEFKKLWKEKQNNQ